MSKFKETDAIHYWFGLSYASYFCMPRSVLQSMPNKWQKDFVKLIEQIPETLEVEIPEYRVQAVNDKGKFIKDELNDYQRGRRQLPFNSKNYGEKRNERT